MANRKELDDLVAKLSRQGWTYRRNKHLIFYSPDKSIPPVTVAISSGGGRGHKNALALLRKYGADV